MNTRSVVCVAAMLAASVSLIQTSQTRAAEKSPYVAPKGTALVVLVRDRFRDRNASMIILNEKRQCVAFISGDKVASELIPMEPGKHSIYAFGGVIQRMDLEVEAGRTYFAHIEYRSRYAAPTINLTPAKRGTETFEKVSGWLKEAQVNDHAADECKGSEEAVESKRGRVQKKIDREDAEWNTKDDAYRADHTINKGDGMTADEVAKLM